MVAPVFGAGKAVGEGGPVGEQDVSVPVAGIATAMGGRRMNGDIGDHAVAIDAVGLGELRQHGDVLIEADLVRQADHHLLGEAGILAGFGGVDGTPEGLGVTHPLRHVVGSDDAEPFHSHFAPVVEGLVAVAMVLRVAVGGCGFHGIRQRAVAIGDGGMNVMALGAADGVNVQMVIAGGQGEGCLRCDQGPFTLLFVFGGLGKHLPTHSAGMRKCTLGETIAVSRCA